MGMKRKGGEEVGSGIDTSMEEDSRMGIGRHASWYVCICAWDDDKGEAK